MSRGTTTLWLGALLCWAFAAWLFLPRANVASGTAPRLHVVLVDASASNARARTWLPWVRRELGRAAAEARAAGDELAVVAFADGLATGFAPGDPALFLEELAGRGRAPFEPGVGLARGATELAAALEGVQPWLRDHERPAGDLLLLGPPSCTGRSPAAALAALRAAGVEITTRAPPAAEESDLGLLEVALAPRVEPGTPLIALARLVLRRGTAPLGTARIDCEVECDGVVREFSSALALPGVDGEFELPLACGTAGPGLNEVRARVSLSSGADLLRENDRASARTVALGARLIGVVSRAEAEAEEWLAPGGRSALPGLQFSFFAPGELGARLAELDAVVTFDLGVHELPAPPFESFVRRGGGWLAVSGWEFLRDWSPGARGALASLLPAEPAASEFPPRDVVLLVDGSGSMEGAPFESVRAAALELVAAALPSDRVELRFFTRSLEPAHELKARSSAANAGANADATAAARELLRLRVPSGATFLLHSLREFRATVGANETLLLLLTDGQDREGVADAQGVAASVATELRAAGVHLVVIGVGEPNLALLAALAGGAEHVRAGRSLADLQAVFRRELHAPRLAEGELELHLAARSRGSLADDVASAAAPTPALAPLERYLRNRLRAGGEALWESATGEAVLSLARAGLGRTAFFASRPGADWARRHAHAADSGLEGVLRWLARGPDGEALPRARLERGVLRVTGLAPRTPAALKIEVLTDGGTRAGTVQTLFPPAELGLDVLRTRELDGAAEWPPSEAFLRLVDGPEADLVLAVERGLPDEFAWRERTVPPAWFGPGTAPRTPDAERAAGTRPLAVLATGLGLVLLFTAGLASSRGQGVRESGR